MRPRQRSQRSQRTQRSARLVRTANRITTVNLAIQLGGGALLAGLLDLHFYDLWRQGYMFIVGNGLNLIVVIPIAATALWLIIASAALTFSLRQLARAAVEDEVAEETDSESDVVTGAVTRSATSAEANTFPKN